jgi:hypothetical protein
MASRKWFSRNDYLPSGVANAALGERAALSSFFPLGNTTRQDRKGASAQPSSQSFEHRQNQAERTGAEQPFKIRQKWQILKPAVQPRCCRCRSCRRHRSKNPKNYPVLQMTLKTIWH